MLNIDFSNSLMTWEYFWMDQKTLLRNTLNLIDQFSKFFGLKPNYDKTKCIWIGSKKGSTTRL